MASMILTLPNLPGNSQNCSGPGLRRPFLPKLEFLRSIGFSGIDIPQVLCHNPCILSKSIDRQLRPCYDIIKSLLLPDLKLAIFYKRCYHQLSVKSVNNIARNVSVLRELKVPESAVSAHLAQRPFVMSIEMEKFNRNVKKVMRMGINPLSATFMKAVCVICVTSASKLAQKIDLYKQCGWSEENFLVAFRKNPFFVLLSEKNISRKIDFIVNKMALVQPADLAYCPDSLTHNLEYWIMPRCSVIRVLLMKGLITKGEFSFSSLMVKSEKAFVNRFVVKYQEQVPELLSIFEGKMSLVELGLEFEES